MNANVGIPHRLLREVGRIWLLISFWKPWARQAGWRGLGDRWARVSPALSSLGANLRLSHFPFW